MIWLESLRSIGGDYIFDNVSLKDISGTLCAIAAIGGVGLTAYFSGKAAVKAQGVNFKEMDKTEKVVHGLKVFGPAILSGLATSGLIIASDRIHVKKEVALGAAVALWKSDYISLDEKVKERLGIDETKEIHKEMAADKMRAAEVSPPKRPGQNLYVHDPYTNQFFWTSRETIAWTMLEANKQLNKNGAISHNAVLKMLGGKPLAKSNLGWSTENCVQDYNWGYYAYSPWIQLDCDLMSDDPSGALVLIYEVEPIEQEPDDLLSNQ